MTQQVLKNLSAGSERRITIEAIVKAVADKFGMHAAGVEYDKDLYSQSSERIRRMGLSEKAKIIHGDLLQQDYTAADLITVYLLPVSNEKLRPLLEKQLKKGARVVAQLILDRMQQANIPHATSPFGHVTVSIGIATAEGAHLAQLQGLIEAADQALYDAKMSGRNRLAEQGANVFPEALAN